jgi:hypothetical protein
MTEDKNKMKIEIDEFKKTTQKFELDLSKRDIEIQMHINKIEMLQKLNKNVFKELDESIMQLNNISIIDHQPNATNISFGLYDKPTDISKKIEHFDNKSYDDIQ